MNKTIDNMFEDNGVTYFLAKRKEERKWSEYICKMERYSDSNPHIRHIIFIPINHTRPIKAEIHNYRNIEELKNEWHIDDLYK